MHVILLPLAINDLANIRSYIAQHNPAAAKNVAKKIKASLILLSEQPLIGHMTDDDNILQWHIPNSNYSLPYRILDNTIQVLRVFDERQNRPESWEL